MRKGGRRTPELTACTPTDFTEVYDRFFKDIYRYVASRLDNQAADDLAAETFLIAYRSREGFDPERGSVRAWLFGIATNLISRHRRQEARHYRALARTGAEPAADSHEDRVVAEVSAGVLKPQLAKALTSLSQRDRDIVLLVALADLSHAEIAQALEIPYGTVGSRFNRARKKLRHVLEGTR